MKEGWQAEARIQHLADQALAKHLDSIDDIRRISVDGPSSKEDFALVRSIILTRLGQLIGALRERERSARNDGVEVFVPREIIKDLCKCLDGGRVTDETVDWVRDVEARLL